MVSKGEVRRVLEWLTETAVLDYSEQIILSNAASDPEKVTGRSTAIAIAKTLGAAEFLQHAAGLLDRVPDDD